jgi:hypothetical protein
LKYETYCQKIRCGNRYCRGHAYYYWAVSISVAHAEAKGKCIGANACRGKSDCSIGKSACGGATANSCKGKGFLLLTKAECDRIPGTKFVSK